MTADELDRALFALPLEESSPDLHGRILNATIYRPRLPLRAWEIYLVGTLVAIAVWLAVFVMTGVPDVESRVSFGLSLAMARVGALVASPAVLWLMLGASSTFWISQISVPRLARSRINH